MKVESSESRAFLWFMARDSSLIAGIFTQTRNSTKTREDDFKYFVFSYLRVKALSTLGS